MTTARRAGAVVKIFAKEESSRDLRVGDRAVHHNHTQFRIGVSEDSKVFLVGGGRVSSRFTDEPYQTLCSLARPYPDSAARRHVVLSLYPSRFYR